MELFGSEIFGLLLQESVLDGRESMLCTFSTTAPPAPRFMFTEFRSLLPLEQTKHPLPNAQLQSARQKLSFDRCLPSGHTFRVLQSVIGNDRTHINNRALTTLANRSVIEILRVAHHHLFLRSLHQLFRRRCLPRNLVFFHKRRAVPRSVSGVVLHQREVSFFTPRHVPVDC